MSRWVVAIGVVGLLFACSGRTSGDTRETSDGGRTASGTGGASAAGGTQSGGAPPDATGGEGGHDCRGITVSYDSQSGDTYLIVDSSSAMSEPASAGGASWLSELTDGMKAYTDARDFPAAELGLQFFPLPAFCGPGYEVPAVDFEAPEAAGPALLTALEERVPAGPSAVGPALLAAYATLAARSASIIGRDRTVVLFTRGAPLACEPTDLVELARNAFAGESRILTQVVALGVDDASTMAMLHDVAQSGGSGRAVRVRATDVQTDLLVAMRRMGNTVSACSYDLPSEASDLGRLSVRLVSRSTGSPEELPFLNRAPDCELNGDLGFYIEPTTSRLSLCPESCLRHRNAPLEIRWNCPRIIDPTR